MSSLLNEQWRRNLLGEQRLDESVNALGRLVVSSREALRSLQNKLIAAEVSYLNDVAVELRKQTGRIKVARITPRKDGSKIGTLAFLELDGARGPLWRLHLLPDEFGFTDRVEFMKGNAVQFERGLAYDIKSLVKDIIDVMEGKK